MTSTGPAELRLNTAVMGGHLAPSPAFIAGIHLRLGIPFALVIEAVEPARPRATT
jgi:hypothetical protein